MNLPKSKAEEILDFCLRDESVEMKTKVYEILSLSEIKVNDPMFLVLALTGQMRVLFETAPTELNQLLDEWKSQTCETITESLEVISQVKVSQKEQIETIQESIEKINSKGVNSIKAINKSMVAEVLSTNTEITLEAKKLIDELTQLHSQIKSDRKDNIKLMESLIQGIGKTYQDLDRINLEIKDSISSLKKVRAYTSRKWIASVMVVLAAFLIIGSSIGFAILARQKSQRSSFIKNNSKQLNSLLINRRKATSILK